MSLPTLTELGSGHGFTTGDLNTDGSVAAVPAYQKVYFADGRIEQNKGYHKLDFINTKLTGAPSAAFDQGEIITQATSGAKGIYNENPDRKLTGAITGTFTKGEVVTQATSEAKGFVVAEVTGAGPLYVFPFSGNFIDSELVTGASSGATQTPTAVGPGQYHLVYRTNTTEFDTTNLITGADTGSTITPSAVTAPPHWFPWTLTTGGFPDGGSNVMALCFGRIFMNDMFNPHHWYATRAGNPLDLLMSQSDVGTAISSQTSKAGLVGDEITAFIPYKDHYLLFGCLNEMWVLRSDPAAGGILTNLSKTTGIFSNTSWCWDDKNNLYFIGTDGIYGISAEAIVNAQPPENLTKEHLPKLMTSMGLNRRTDRITMAYDKDHYGILISVVQMDGVWSTTFWLDLRAKGIFPEKYQDDHTPASMLYFDSRRADYRGLMCGGQDGYIRKFSEDDKSDDGDNIIESWVTIGPLVDKENPRAQIRLTHLSAVTGLNTTNLEISLYQAKTAEKLIDNILTGESPQVLRTFTNDKLLPSIRQKISGGALAIKLSNSVVDKTWNIEKITANIEQSGRIK